MSKYRIPLFRFVFATCCILASFCQISSALEDSLLQCYRSTAILAPIDAPDYRKYAPDRDVQVSHLYVAVGGVFAVVRRVNWGEDGRGPVTLQKRVLQGARDLTKRSQDAAGREDEPEEGDSVFGHKVALLLA